MKTVWKYKLEGVGKNVLNLPESSKPLCVQLQDGYPVLWVELDAYKTETARDRIFHVAGTGWDVPDNTTYIDTVQMNGFVWHVFEEAALAQCSRCNGYYPQDPKHPGYADVHKCNA